MEASSEASSRPVETGSKLLNLLAASQHSGGCSSAGSSLASIERCSTRRGVSIAHNACLDHVAFWARKLAFLRTPALLITCKLGEFHRGASWQMAARVQDAAVDSTYAVSNH